MTRCNHCDTEALRRQHGDENVRLLPGRQPSFGGVDVEVRGASGEWRLEMWCAMITAHCVC